MICLSKTPHPHLAKFDLITIQFAELHNCRKVSKAGYKGWDVYGIPAGYSSGSLINDDLRPSAAKRHIKTIFLPSWLDRGALDRTLPEGHLWLRHHSQLLRQTPMKGLCENNTISRMSRSRTTIPTMGGARSHFFHDKKHPYIGPKPKEKTRITTIADRMSKARP